MREFVYEKHPMLRLSFGNIHTKKLFCSIKEIPSISTLCFHMFPVSYYPEGTCVICLNMGKLSKIVLEC